MAETGAELTHHLGWAYLGLLYGGTAMFLATFGYTAGWSSIATRVVAAAVVLVLLSVTWMLSALGAILLLAAAVVALNDGGAAPGPPLQSRKYVGGVEAGSRL
jgi:hypothetical protein